MGRNLRQNQDGYVLVTALIALAVMAILATTTIGQATTALRMAAEAVRSEQALYMANAGVERVLALVSLQEEIEALYEEPAWVLEEGLIGSYEARVSWPEEGLLRVRSTGRVERGSLSATRVVVADIGYATKPEKPVKPVTPVIHGGAWVEIGNNGRICGDVVVGGGDQPGDLQLTNNVEVGCTPGEGNVTVTGKLLNDEKATIGGTLCEADGTDRCGQVPRPTTIGQPRRPTEAEANHKSRDLTLTDALPYVDGDIIYVNGNLTIGAKQGSHEKEPILVTGSLTFVVTGKTLFEKNLYCAEGATCEVRVFTRDLELPNNLLVRAKLYPTGDTTIGNNVQLCQELIAKGHIQIGSDLQVGNTGTPVECGSPTAPGTLYTSKTLTSGNGLVVHGRLGAAEVATIGNNAVIRGQLTGGKLIIGNNLELYPGTHSTGEEDGAEPPPGEDTGEQPLPPPGYIRWQQ